MQITSARFTHPLTISPNNPSIYIKNSHLASSGSTSKSCQRPGGFQTFSTCPRRRFGSGCKRIPSESTSGTGRA